MPSSKPFLVASRALLVSVLAATSTAFAGMERAIYISPIPDNPLTAVVRINQTRIRPDGSKVSIVVEETIARDGQGRMYRDRWYWDPATNKPTALITIDLFDPATSTYTIMQPGSKTYWVGKLERQNYMLGDGFFYDSHDDGSPKSQFDHGQDVGSQEMQGVSVHHVRQVDQINGSTSKMDVTSEYWYSEDLRMSLAASLDDPRAVKQTSTVTELIRKEPDTGIYRVPAGYRRVNDWSAFQASVAKVHDAGSLVSSR
jgi:hypothetical protein